MKRIMNLTQHAPSPEQVAAGVVVNDADLQAKVSKLLTFVDLPSKAEVQQADGSVVKTAQFRHLGFVEA